MIKKFSEIESVNNLGAILYGKNQSYLTDKDKIRACDNLGVANVAEVEQWRNELYIQSQTIAETKQEIDQASIDVAAAVSAANSAVETADAAAQSVLDKPLNTSIAPLFNTTTNYKIGEKVMYNGELYVFNADVAAGAWSTSNRSKTSVKNQAIMACQFINNVAKANSVFGDPASLSNAKWNTIYTLSRTALAAIDDAPVNDTSAILITYTGNSAGQAATQIFNTSNKMWFRLCFGNVWSDWHEINSDIDTNKIPTTVKRISSADEASTEFNNDLNNAKDNTIYAVVYITGVANVPNNQSGTLYTYTGNTADGNSAVQIYVGNSGKFYVRTKWSNTWNTWQEMITSHTINTYYCGNSTNAEEIFGETLDLNNTPKNSIITVAYTGGLQHLPFSGAYGILETYTGRLSGNTLVQYFSIASDGANNNRVYNRTKWSTGWTDWTLMNKREETKYGRITDETSAHEFLNNTSSVNNAPENSVLVLNWSSGLTDLPEGLSSTQGFLITRSRIDSDTSKIQFFVRKGVNELYIRTQWSAAWSEWTLVQGGSSSQSGTEYIATFERIGACGGSYTTGYSNYVDSSNVQHGVNFKENSWVQLWGRKHGISAYNFSSAGWSIKDWFNHAENVSACEANPCKVYFTLFGGGNDIEDYNGVSGLGTIDDVHVGDESQNPRTFYGDYSRLIAKLQSVGGQKTKIISFTYGQVFGSSKTEVQLAYIKAINDVAALYDNVFVIATMDDAKLISIKTSPYWFKGHYSAIGYKKIADRLEEMVNTYVDAHQTNFADIQWIGTEYDVAQWY